MARSKARNTDPHPKDADAGAPASSLRDSAQHIWMAGLSAFAKAQAGGNKVFEALMKEGESLQNRTRQAARDQVDDMTARASGTWDKLEAVFETRVARALHSLGVPTHDDIATLSARVAALSTLVDGLQQAPADKPATAGKGSGATTSRTKKASVQPSAGKPAAKKATAQKATAKKAPARKSAAIKAAPNKSTARKSAGRQTAA